MSSNQQNIKSTISNTTIQSQRPSISSNLTQNIAADAQSQQVTINCKTLTGKTIRIISSVMETIEQLKQKIQNIQGIPVDQIRLVYAGRILENQRLMSDYRIVDQCTVHIVLRLRGDIGIFDIYNESIGRSILSGEQESAQLGQIQINQIIKQLKGDPNSDFQAKKLDIHETTLSTLRKYADTKYQEAINAKSNPEQLQDLKIYMNREQLIHLIGQSLCIELQNMFSSDYTNIVLRRCQAYGKMIKLHIDQFSYRTLQLTLNDESEYLGGRLLYLTKGKMEVPTRKKGVVTIHDNKIVHGVTVLQKGVRYGLFLLQK